MGLFLYATRLAIIHIERAAIGAVEFTGTVVNDERLGQVDVVHGVHQAFPLLAGGGAHLHPMKPILC